MLVLVLAFVWPVEVPAWAGSTECVGSTEMGSSHEVCSRDAQEIAVLRAKHPDSELTFTSEKEVCSREDADGDLCSTPHLCAGEGQQFYRVTLGSVWQGFACLTPAEVAELSIDWYSIALETMTTYGWPAAELTVRPGAEVLVNGETHFSTTLSGAETVTRSLHGRVLTVRATPVRYDWVFGDGDSVKSLTADAGVVHVYPSKGEYGARVDVTYTGEYRVGQGAWTPISTSRTVRGPELLLTALEAKPVLVL